VKYLEESESDVEFGSDVLVNLPKNKYQWLMEDVTLGPPEFRKALENYWKGIVGNGELFVSEDEEALLG